PRRALAGSVGAVRVDSLESPTTRRASQPGNKNLENAGGCPVTSARDANSKPTEGCEPRKPRLPRASARPPGPRPPHPLHLLPVQEEQAGDHDDEPDRRRGRDRYADLEWFQQNGPRFRRYASGCMDRREPGT